MSRLIDMTGWIMAEHGVPESRLKVLQRVENRITPNGCVKAQWLCECLCEKHTQFVTTGERIRYGITKSCGCLLQETATQTIKQYQPMSAKLKRKYNEYTFFDTYGQGKFSNCEDVFLFDIEDFDLIKDYCWYKDNHGYAVSHVKGTDRKEKRISMHILLGFKYGDHINRDRTDNRKENLRDATPRENVRNRGVASNNTSGVVGVSWDKSRQKWRAYIRLEDGWRQLGRFLNKDAAVRARLEAEAKYFKEFAPQRHLFEQYGIQEENT